MDKREIDTLYSVPPALVDGKFYFHFGHASRGSSYFGNIITDLETSLKT